MKALIIGGARHGQWVDVLDGVQAWVDITSATTHRIRRVNNFVTDVTTGQVTEAWVVSLAVHPDLTGPREPQVVGALVQQMAMNEFARAHGEQQDVPQEPHKSELALPSDG